MEWLETVERFWEALGYETLPAEDRAEIRSDLVAELEAERDPEQEGEVLPGWWPIAEGPEPAVADPMTAPRALLWAHPETRGFAVQLLDEAPPVLWVPVGDATDLADVSRRYLATDALRPGALRLGVALGQAHSLDELVRVMRLNPWVTCLGSDSEHDVPNVVFVTRLSGSRVLLELHDGFDLGDGFPLLAWIDHAEHQESEIVRSYSPAALPGELPVDVLGALALWEVHALVDVLHALDLPNLTETMAARWVASAGRLSEDASVLAELATHENAEVRVAVAYSARYFMRADVEETLRAEEEEQVARRILRILGPQVAQG